MARPCFPSISCWLSESGVLRTGVKEPQRFGYRGNSMNARLGLGQGREGLFIPLRTWSFQTGCYFQLLRLTVEFGFQKAYFGGEARERLDEMASLVKGLVAKPEDLNLIHVV